MPIDEKGNQLKAILTLLGQTTTKGEIRDAFATITKYVQGIQNGNEKEWNLIRSALSMLEEKLRSGNATDISEAKKELKSSVQDALKEQKDSLERMHNHVRKLKDGYTPVKGVDYVDGKDADEEKITATLLSKIPSEHTPFDIRDKLHSLEGEDRLDAMAIKNLPEATKKLIGLGSTRGVQLLVNTNKKGLANYLNLIPGSNVTLTYAYSNGRNDITISSSGSGGSGYQAPLSGGLTGTNTWTTSPNVIVVDQGRAMQRVSTDGTVNWTVSGSGPYTTVLTIAPTSDVYASS